MTERTNAPSCPYCSHIETDAWEIDFGSAVLDGDTCHTCNSCGREYNLSRHVSVSYSARPIIDDPACNPQAKVTEIVAVTVANGRRTGRP